MSNYLLIYTGGDAMPESQDARDQIMAAWGAWFESMGEAVVDAGAPTGAAQTVGPDGTVSPGSAGGAGGYSIISADSHDAAVGQARGCPVLASNGSVEVYETFEI